MSDNNTQSSFKELVVWQKSMILANDVIDLVDHLETDRKHYRLIEQLEAAVTSVPMNIAEGKGRESKKEYVHYLYISRGSLYETLTLMEIFLMRGWITPDTYQKLENQSNEIAKMLNGLINYIRKSI
ncbi:MAG: four helix bundle protein [Chloroflexi bacterium]|nr:four helix bundle protein [Chloroflexota bacterium]